MGVSDVACRFRISSYPTIGGIDGGVSCRMLINKQIISEVSIASLSPCDMSNVRKGYVAYHLATCCMSLHVMTISLPMIGLLNQWFWWIQEF